MIGNCVLGLVFIAGVYVNPCDISFMRPYNMEHCAVSSQTGFKNSIHYVPATCDKVYEAIQEREKENERERQHNPQK